MDVVCLWDTIEHLKNPDLYIEKVADNYDRGGMIAITTGDIGSLVARLRGSEVETDPPTHSLTLLFSKLTLTRFCSRLVRLHSSSVRAEGVYEYGHDRVTLSQALNITVSPHMRLSESPNC